MEEVGMPLAVPSPPTATDSFVAMIGHDPALASLCRRFHVRRLDLFGSATTGRFDADRSDLDFLVAFDESLPTGAYADAYFGLREGLEELFRRTIDLVAEPALQNPYLRRSIEAQRRTLYPLSAPA